MNTNLQSFPRWRGKYYRMNPTDKALVKYRDDVMEWFDNHKAELRELMNKSKEANMNPDYTVVYVKEILGENGGK